MKALPILSLTLVALAAKPVLAQDSGLDRRSFPFFDSHLTIEIRTESGGTLEVLRGGRGRIEVSSRAPEAVLAYAPPRATGGPLRLSASGGRTVQYIVVVPDGVQVNVQLPDEPDLSPAAAHPAEVYKWGPAGGVPEAGDNVMVSALTIALSEAYSDISAPGELTLPGLASIRRIGIRIEGTAFRVASSSPVSVQRADAGRVDVRPGAEPVDVEIFLPRGTQQFVLRVAGNELFAVRGGQPRTDCGPVTVQNLPDGNRWYDFVPTGGRLVCGN
jgi:hypothetical protein